MTEVIRGGGEGNSEEEFHLFYDKAGVWQFLDGSQIAFQRLELTSKALVVHEGGYAVLFKIQAWRHKAGGTEDSVEIVVLDPVTQKEIAFSRPSLEAIFGQTIPLPKSMQQLSKNTSSN